LPPVVDAVGDATAAWFAMALPDLESALPGGAAGLRFDGPAGASAWMLGACGIVKPEPAAAGLLAAPVCASPLGAVTGAAARSGFAGIGNAAAPPALA
jgi:hypothetical protein